jgi:A/G-specific adenine glycosylase
MTRDILLFAMQLNASKKNIVWFRTKVLNWGSSNFSEFIWRSSEIAIHQLLVEILLQRTKAEQVVPVFIELAENYPDIDSLSLLNESDLLDIIHPLGLHWRAPLLYKLIQAIKNDFNGKIPEDNIELQKLPGVGQYVSSSYLSLHRNKRAVIIDSNVVRVYARFFGFDFDGETRRKKWLYDLANKITPQRVFRKFNYALLDFAKSICKRPPACIVCSLKTKCAYFKMDT